MITPYPAQFGADARSSQEYQMEKKKTLHVSIPKKRKKNQ